MTVLVIDNPPGLADAFPIIGTNWKATLNKRETKALLSIRKNKTVYMGKTYRNRVGTVSTTTAKQLCEFDLTRRERESDRDPFELRLTGRGRDVCLLLEPETS